MQHSGIIKSLLHFKLNPKTASKIVTQRWMIMIPRHLTGYQLLWFDLGTILFLKSPKIRQTFAQDP